MQNRLIVSSLFNYCSILMKHTHTHIHHLLTEIGDHTQKQEHRKLFVNAGLQILLIIYISFANCYTELVHYITQQGGGDVAVFNVIKLAASLLVDPSFFLSFFLSLFFRY